MLFYREIAREREIKIKSNFTWLTEKQNLQKWKNNNNKRHKLILLFIEEEELEEENKSRVIEKVFIWA